MANDSLGSIITQGNFLRIDNAFVDADCRQNGSWCDAPGTILNFI